jgi:hypothetical protein
VPYGNFTSKVQGAMSSVGRILSTFPFLMCLYRYISVDICAMIGESTTIRKSISDKLKTRFILARAV